MSSGRLPLIGVQEIQHEAVAVNIEVPVRVYSGGTFIDDLRISDFELWEDGVLQKIEAVYLVRKTDILREESGAPGSSSARTISPQVNRNFTLLFEVTDWLPELGEAVRYFFDQVYSPQDALTVITPRKSYSIRPEAFHRLGQERIARQLIEKLRKDIQIANAEYKSLVRDIEELYTSRGIFEHETGDQKTTIRELLDLMETVRQVDEKRLLAFSEYLKGRPGQKNVFLFYQKEMLPKYDPFKRNLVTSGNPEENPAMLFKVMEITDFYRREISFDVEKIKRIFSDSSILVNFLYLTKIPQHNLDVQRMETLSAAHIRYQEQSEDIFKAFGQVARATGGYTGSSYDASAVFQRAADACENYYLLYYSPREYREDGSFRTLKVKVKGRSYRVTHRAGYLAD
jgi:VWFA-related protein